LKFLNTAMSLLLPGVVEQVAGCVAERTGRGRCEGGGVEPEVLVRSAAEGTLLELSKILQPK
jgi:hypothetical protein